MYQLSTFLVNYISSFIGDRLTHAITAEVDIKTVALVGHSFELLSMQFLL
ncbi:hypothetical protein [Nostoc sp. NIES-3756]|nr:hypothetical protein [Nostoc sp. NIES-3756]